MNDSTSIAALYRRRTKAAAELDQLMDALERGAAAPEAVEHLGQSSDAALLARMLRELEPDSVALAAEVASLKMQDGSRIGSRRRRNVSHTRHAGGRRAPATVRWLAASAASVALVAAGVLMLARLQPDAGSFDSVVSGAQTAPVPDRIFTDRDRIFATVDDTPAAAGDGLFRADFGGS